MPNRAAQNWGSGVTGSRVAAPQHAGEAKLSYNRSLSKSAREFELKLRAPGEASTRSEASCGNLWILSLHKKALDFKGREILGVVGSLWQPWAENRLWNRSDWFPRPAC